MVGCSRREWNGCFIGCSLVALALAWHGFGRGVTGFHGRCFVYYYENFFLLQLQRHCGGAFGVEGCVTCGVNDELLPYDQFCI